jgi:hypothetical protein
MEVSSRIALANRQLRIARIAVGTAAVAAFVVFGAVARAAHPGSAGSTRSAQSSSADDPSQSTFDFGTASVGPSTGGSVAVQSGGS